MDSLNQSSRDGFIQLELERRIRSIRARDGFVQLQLKRWIHSVELERRIRSIRAQEMDVILALRCHQSISFERDGLVTTSTQKRWIHETISFSQNNTGNNFQWYHELRRVAETSKLLENLQLYLARFFFSRKRFCSVKKWILVDSPLLTGWQKHQNIMLESRLGNA